MKVRLMILHSILWSLSTIGFFLSTLDYSVPAWQHIDTSVAITIGCYLGSKAMREFGEEAYWRAVVNFWVCPLLHLAAERML